MAEGEGFERFGRAENRQLIENYRFTNRTNLTNWAKLERNWNIAFSSPRLC